MTHIGYHPIEAPPPAANRSQSGPVRHGGVGRLDRSGLERFSGAESERYEVRPFFKIRRAYVDALAAGHRKHTIHGLVEIDVTVARRALDHLEQAGRRLSFTAFVVHAVARAVEGDRALHAYRHRDRLVLFDDVDVNTQVEVDLGAQKIPRSVVVRAANRKTVQEIAVEIRAAQHHGEGDDRFYRAMLAFVSMPRPVRSLAWRVVMANPRWFKRLGGTVGVSSIGMFGPAGGWGIPIAPPTLMITVGGIAIRPRLLNGSLEEREVVSLTISVDHDIVDGAPAARFAGRLAAIMERAEGLAPTIADDSGADAGGRPADGSHTHDHHIVRKTPGVVLTDSYGGPDVLDRNGLEILDRDECMRLLASVKVGRVGVTTDAMPVVLPVTFALDGDRIVFSSAPGTKLYTAMSDAVVAFEADDVGAGQRWGWSVCLTGPARVLTSPDEIERAGRLGLQPWADLSHGSYIAIEGQVVTGRRVQRGKAGPLAAAGARDGD